MNGFRKANEVERAYPSNREDIISRLSYAHDLALKCMTLTDKILRPELVLVPEDHYSESEYSH